LGTGNVLRCAVDCDAEHFVLISTDKAVRPTSVMGATKRVAEMIVQQAALHHGRNFVSVRFGNVMGSRCSVVPIFLGQIRAGGPLTITHPDMRRYFMTIPEAVELVLQASALGRCGEVFVLDMGEPIRIVDLATDLVRLSGLEVGRDIEIRYTGIRPGERLYEEPFFRHEEVLPTAHSKILRATDNHVPADVGAAIDAVDSTGGPRSRPSQKNPWCRGAKGQAQPNEDFRHHPQSQRGRAPGPRATCPVPTRYSGRGDPRRQRQRRRESSDSCSVWGEDRID